MNPILRLGFTLGVAAVAASLPAHARIERDVEKTFTVPENGTLNLQTSGGSLQVEPGPSGVVKIVAHERISADSDAEADQLLKKLDLAFSQSGSEVRASARYDDSHVGFHFGSWPPVHVSFIATVPASFAATLNTSGGGITVGDLKGAVTARTSGGPIHLGRIGGPVDARTSGGGISIADAQSQTVLDTSGGPIRIGNAEDSLQARTSGGSIEAAFAGPIHVPCELSTSGGGVRVTVSKSAAFHLDAKTSGGSVHAAGLALASDDTGGFLHNRLSGDVNGGGSTLKLRTSGGGISVETR